MDTMGHMYFHLDKNMDKHVTRTAGVLLHKVGEANKFIRVEVEQALEKMVRKCSSGPVLNVLLNTVM